MVASPRYTRAVTVTSARATDARTPIELADKRVEAADASVLSNRPERAPIAGRAGRYADPTLWLTCGRRGVIHASTARVSSRRRVGSTDPLSP